jgi:hypothetical protein
VTEGSQGQLVLHPLTKYVAQLDGEIRQLEDRFGLNPKARIALGLELTKARRSLDDLMSGWRAEDAEPAPTIDLTEDARELGS